MAQQYYTDDTECRLIYNEPIYGCPNYGCMDQIACNYDESANTNNDSC